MPYRVAAPPEPEPPELEEPYVAVLRAQRRRARIVTAVAFAALGVVGTAKAASVRSSSRTAIAESQAEVARERVARHDEAALAIARARSRAAAAQGRFDAAIHAAVRDGLHACPELGACPVRLGPPRIARLPVPGKSAFPVLELTRNDLAETVRSRAVADVLVDVLRAEQHLDAGRYDEAGLYARALDRPERFDFEVVLVDDDGKTTHAAMVSGSEYEPGAVSGTAYLYDFATDRVECAAHVEARSSREIGYVYSDRTDAPVWLSAGASLNDAIREDLRVQVEKAVIDGLRFRAGR